ncbi:aromatic-ring-hydroxylating dioxygenase subunit beta [Bordetella genomosp. 1]|uniref:Aromatic-ring-hydroxylating dioxygenase subunit beta n=1 Tax=Bordetella genomosp. 1 TaxID=1395607 RepID=A0ABX4F5A0_9BORD|nr:aromatic-ring-hydroxylating dioxygenase subunit beta [Bordetella genomosp. 1]OZI68930.1 aromatic-ring-hydroxylating dioxygenase subunit beta [Bordetella genomosp. 1]
MLLEIDFDVSTAHLAPASLPPETYHAVCQFLYREARLLDTREYDAWQSLWTEDGMYWMPHHAGQQSPYDHVSLFWEDRMLRDVRIRRLLHPRNWSQQPPTRSARIVGNVMIEGVDTGGNLVVHSAFQMTEWRKRQPRQLAGHYTHKLAAEGEGWRIRMKRVDLVNCDDAHDAFEVYV